MSAPTFRRGFVAGLLGAAVFALFFLVVDVVKGQPLTTPAYLAGLLFGFTTALPATARVLLMTLLHFVGFGLVGALVAKVFVRPRALFAIPLAIVLCATLVVGGLVAFRVNVADQLGWSWLLIGYFSAATVMIASLRRKPAPA